MFGWEFPPHISGGLGTACYGLTKGLNEIEGIDILFVVPKVFGDEKHTKTKLIGANNVVLNQKELKFNSKHKKINYLEVDSPIIPYVSEDEFWKFKNGKYSENIRLIQTNEGYKIDFSGSYGGNLFYEVKNYALVSEFIAKNKSFDIIHAHDWLTYPAGIAVRSISGKPLIIHVHATEFDRSNGNINQNIYDIEREGMENATKIIAVSNLTRNTIIEKYNIPPKKVITIYNAVEPLRTIGKKTNKKVLSEKIVTFLGRITTQKGPEYFIEAANIILKKMNNVRFVMAGSGDLMNTMIARAAELKITDKFHFTGFLNDGDVFRMLEMTDVFVMPSVSEPFGIVPLEAMQSGVPVIISNQSGVAEVVENVIKIDFWNINAMADAIYGLLNYPSLAKIFKEKGKEEVRNLKWKNSAEKVYKIYKNAMK
jgi:glycosyltransferase involved in cell wall biosynthesis